MPKENVQLTVDTEYGTKQIDSLEGLEAVNILPSL